jgi:hypothetical protein
LGGIDARREAGEGRRQRRWRLRRDILRQGGGLSIGQIFLGFFHGGEAILLLLRQLDGGGNEV